MKYPLSTLVLAAASWLAVAPALAQEKSNQEQAVALVKKAIDTIKKQGHEKAFAELNRLDSPFNTKSDINPHGDMYMLVYQFDGVQPVHGKNPKIPGKNVLDMRDADGTYLIKDMLAACNSKAGNGWVSYKWPHSITKVIEAKQTYVEKTGEYCVGTGIYK